VPAEKKIKLSGIIIHTVAYGEAHKIITLFTPDKGFVSAMAHGARKMKSKFRGRVEILNQVEGLFHSSGKSSLLVLEEIQVVESFAARLDYDKVWILFPFLRALYLFHFSSEEENQKIFEMFQKLLRIMERHKEAGNFKLLLYAFLLKSLVMTSMVQNYKYCCFCGKENLAEVYFNVQKAQISCQDCKASHAGFYSLARPLYRFLIKIIYSKFEEIINLKVGEQELNFTREVLQTLFLVIFEKRWDDFEKEGNPFNH